MTNTNQSISEVSPTKNIFASKTFWAAIFTAITAIAPIVGEAVDNRRISGEKAADIVVILSGTALTIIGRVQAKTAIQTTPGIPGVKKETP